MLTHLLEHIHTELIVHALTPGLTTSCQSAWLSQWNVRPLPDLETQVVSNASNTMSRLQPIFVQRFVIALRQTEQSSATAMTTLSTRMSVLNIRTPTIHDIVGNMGETLEFGMEEDSDREESYARAMVRKNDWDTGDREHDAVPSQMAMKLENGHVRDVRRPLSMSQL